MLENTKQRGHAFIKGVKQWFKRLLLMAIGAVIISAAWYVVDRESSKEALSETKISLSTCQGELEKAHAEPERLKASALEQGLVLQ